MKNIDEKILMSQIAILYYEKNLTQQEIADKLSISRQTVSKLLNEAIKEKIVEIKIHNPKKDCQTLEQQLCDKFKISKCVVCGVSNNDESLRLMMTVRATVDYIVPILKKGNLKIALSWGRTVQQLIKELPKMNTNGNTVFPLFGATDNEISYFSSNELARGMADKINANVKCAWFPYMADSIEECRLLKNFSYYQKLKSLWDNADVAIVGIGNSEMTEIFGKTFGYKENRSQVIGDIATHFFNEKGEFVELYDNTLCASVEEIKSAAQTIAVACGDVKVTAIVGALKTGIIDTLITDEHTARKALEII